MMTRNYDHSDLSPAPVGSGDEIAWFKTPQLVAESWVQGLAGVQTIDVRCVKIPADIDSAEKSRLLSVLSPAEKRHYQGIKRPGRQREYLLGHVLLRLVMACDGCKGRHFNLSHSGVWVVCASADHPVGVDVECVRHRPRAPDIAAKWFPPQENRFLLSCDPTQRPLAFTRLWVLKEALFKTGLLALKDLVGKSFFQITKAGRVKSLKPSWQFSLHALSRGYVLGLACAATRPISPVIERVKWQSLCASREPVRVITSSRKKRDARRNKEASS